MRGRNIAVYQLSWAIANVAAPGMFTLLLAWRSFAPGIALSLLVVLVLGIMLLVEPVRRHKPSAPFGPSRRQLRVGAVPDLDEPEPRSSPTSFEAHVDQADWTEQVYLRITAWSSRLA